MKKYFLVFLSLFLLLINGNSQSLKVSYSGSWPENLNTKVMYWNVFDGYLLSEFSSFTEEVKIPDSIGTAILSLQVFDKDHLIYEKKILYNNTPLSLRLSAKDYTITIEWEQGGLNPVYEKYQRERAAEVKRLYVFQNICLYYGEQESEFYQKTVSEREKTIRMTHKIQDKYEKFFAGLPAKSYLDVMTLSIPDYRDDKITQIESMLNAFFQNYMPMDVAILNSPIYKEKLDEYINLSIEFASAEGDYNEKAIIEYLDKYFYQIIDDESLVAATGEEMRKRMHRLSLENVERHIDINYLAQCHAAEDDGLKKRLAQYEKLAIGKDAPSFTWKDEKGNIHKLSDFDATNYVVIFWASWCGHCGQILPNIHAFLAKQKNVMTLAIGLDKDKEKWDFARTNYPKWHHYQAVEQWDNAIAEDFAVYATPTIYVLDKTLKIKGKARNIKELENVLK